MTEPRKTPRADAFRNAMRERVVYNHEAGDLVEQLEVETQELAEALEDLYDEQSGAPLVRREKQWECAMTGAINALTRHRAKQEVQK